MALPASSIPTNAPAATDPTTLSVRQAFAQVRTEVDGIVTAVNAGVQGAQGHQGAVGAQGAAGPQGNAGAQGSAGAQGAQGAQGASGTGGAATAILADATTEPVGTHPQGTLLIDENTGVLWFKLGTQWIPVQGM